MIIMLFNQIVQGISMVIASFSHIRHHWRLVLYASLTPLLTLTLTPLLFKLITHLNYFNIPNWIYTLFFSFIGFAIFNYIYFGLVTYHFKLFAHQSPTFRDIIAQSNKKIFLIVYWSLVSTLTGTLLTVVINYLHMFQPLRYSVLFFLVTKLVDGIWWAVNFLIIPALAVQESSITRSLLWIVSILQQLPGLIISAASMLFVFKYYSGEFAFYVAQHAPRLMQQLHLITVTPENQRLFIFVYLPATVLIISSIIAMVNITAESILSTTIYLYSKGQSVEEMYNLTWKQLVLQTVIIIGLFALVISVLSVILLGICFTVPDISTFFSLLFS